MQQNKEVKYFVYAMVNRPFTVVWLADCHLLFDPSFLWEMISHGWWTCVGYILKPTAHPLEMGYFAEERTRWRWNLTDESSVLVAHRNLTSMLVTHQNLLRYNNALYPCAKRLYNHLVVCEYRELCQELSGQTMTLSLKSRVHRVKGTGITNSFQALFLARARRY